MAGVGVTFSTSTQRAFVPVPQKANLQHRSHPQTVVCASSEGSCPPSTSRRSALLAAAVLPPLIAATPASPALADDAASSSNRVFFDVAVDGKPFGRIVVEVNPKAAPIGAQRFLDLAGKRGREGVSFRRTKIELIQDGYIQDSGLKAMSYTASGRTGVAGGPTAELLEDELNASALRHDGPGVVSLVVRNAKERETKEKLVAVKGKLVTVVEVLGDVPNGSAFAITTRAEPALDNTNLVVGRVVEGQEVVDALAALPRVKDNAASPFFK